MLVGEENEITHLNILPFFLLVKQVSYASEYLGVHKSDKFFFLQTVFSLFLSSDSVQTIGFLFIYP